MVLSAGSTVILVQVLDQGAYDPWVLRMLGLTGLIGESVNFTDDEIHRSFVFVTQGLVRSGDEESITGMFLVPSEIAQFSGVKRVMESRCKYLSFWNLLEFEVTQCLYQTFLLSRYGTF